jgi:hypothetical protein
MRTLRVVRTHGILPGHHGFMLIGAYGMFWLRDEVEWSPGSGPNAWHLLGRNGERKPKLRVVDFRRARGVYILFDDFGAQYVGLARGSGGLGERLKSHDVANDKTWDRFCWFSFDRVSIRRDSSGLNLLELRRKPVPTRDESVIRELEALLITILGTRDQNRMRFEDAEEWSQVRSYATSDYLRKVRI